MVTFPAVLKFVLGHILAGAVVIFGSLLVALVCYAFGLSTATHGIESPFAVIPEFLSVMFMVGFLAVIISTVCFLISVLLVWLRAKCHFPAWIPVVGVPIVAFVVLLAFRGASDMRFGALMAGLSFVYFGVYWTILTLSGVVLDFLCRMVSNKKAG